MASSASTLVGRDGVLAKLSGAVQAVTDGYGGCLVLEGPAGIGKTRLLAETVPATAASGVAVGAARATELDRVAPLSVLLAALRASTPPVLDAKAAERLLQTEGTVWLIDQLGELIEIYSRQRPLVIALDDLQWVDECTALALRSLIPAVRSSPVLWLLAHRPYPAHAPARVAIESLIADGATHLELPPLSDQAVGDLCRELLDAAPGPELRRLAAGGGGNPFLLEELVTTLQRAGRIQVREQLATVTEGDLPESFLAVVEHGLGDLSPPARRLVEAGAVLRRPFTLHEAAGLVDSSAVQLISAAQEAVTAGILVPHASEFSFKHDLLREAVYDALPRPVRTAMHREASTVLRREGRSITEIAEHVLHGGRSGDTGWAAVLQEAAAQLAPEAPSAAADLLLRARELVAERDPAQSRLAAETVQLLASAGRITEARAQGEAALRQRPGPAAEANLLRGLAEAAKHAGQDALVVTYARRGLELPEVPEATRAQLLAVQAHGLLHTDGLAAAERAAAAAVAAGRASGEYAAAVFGQVAGSVVARARGDLSAAVRLARDAVELADSAGGEARHRHPRLWLARALTASDSFLDAAAEFDTCRAEIERLGTAWAHPLQHRFLAELHCAQGRLDDAWAEVEAGLQVAEQRSATALTPALLALLAQLAIRRGDLPAAERSLARAGALVAGGSGVAAEDLTWVTAQLDLARGRPDPAFRAITPLYELLPEQVAVFALEPRAAAVMVQLALGAGAGTLADRVVRAAQQAADRNPAVPSLAAAAAHCAGLYRQDLAALREAVKLYADSPRPLDLAAALESTAEAEQRAGQRQRASRRWSEARERYLAAGAVGDAARLRGHRITARRSRTGWDSLTPSELRVVRLVAAGLTNREVAAELFLSRHTVDSHLRHAFGKLGISRRVELTREVVSREAPAHPVA